MSLRVLHALDHALPQVSGYSIRSHGLLCGQRSRGIEASAVALSSQVSQPTRASIDGVPYLCAPDATRSRPATPLSAVGRILRLARQLNAESRTAHAAILHAHSPSLNGIAALWAAHTLRLPVVYEMRALWESASVDRNLGREGDLRYRSARALETWLLRRATAVVVISQGLHDEVLRRGVPEHRVVCVPNGVDTAAFNRRPPDAELVRQYGLGGQTVFGYLGFLPAYEGVDVLLRAFARMARELPAARLLLIGSGDGEHQLRNLAAELGVAARVTFTGAAQREDVQRWYSVCDVLVYPRRHSRLTDLVTPLKPLEAMAMAKPVVASDVGGLREILRDDETGILCTPEDPEALAAALVGLAASPQRRETLGANARRFVCAERGWTQLAGISERLYENLLAGQTARRR